jgi:hypothetical protein
VYTVMLLLSMLFLLVAVIAMWIERNRWAPDFENTRSAQPSSAMLEPLDSNRFG